MKYSTSNQSNWFHVNFYIIFHENAQQIFFLNSGKKTHIKKCKKCLKLCLCGWTITESQSWRVLGHIRVLGGEVSCVIIAVVGGRNGLSTMDRAKNWLPPQRRIRNLFTVMPTPNLSGLFYIFNRTILVARFFFRFREIESDYFAFGLGLIFLSAFWFLIT